jgi:serine/threonine protein kinase
MTICPNDGTVLSGAVAPKLISNLAGQYEFIEKIGEGGMGVIYKARHLALNHLVAIKMMHVNQLDQNKMLRFQQEAKAVSSLDHPSIVRVRDFGISESGQPHMVLDYIDGVTLDAMIKTHGPLSLGDAKDLFAQICDAVAHAHQRRVLHRDLKPSNIMLVYRENQPPLAVIVDFGIAKVVDPGQQQGMNLTQTGEIFGSPFYMSPEQTAGKELDQRSDIYSVGCVLFEALTGAPPFVGKNAIETLIMHTSSLPPTLKQGSLGKVFPEALQAVVDTALAKNPQDRFQDITSFKVALIQAMEQPKTPASATVEEKKRSRVNKLAVFVTCLIAVLTSAWFFTKHFKPATSVPGNVQVSTSSNAQVTTPSAAPAGTAGTASGNQPGQSKPKELDATLPDVEAGLAHIIVRDKDKDNIVVEYLTDRTMVDFDQVVNATKVSLLHCSIEGPGLKHLEHLHLKSLIIKEDPVLRESALEIIANQSDLEELSLEEDPITDESLMNLNNLSKLHILNLARTAVSDSGLYRMKELKSLETLDLHSCKRLADRDLTELQAFPHLKDLRINETDLKKISLISKGPTINVEVLLLDDTPFDDASIRDCKPMPNLIAISLARTAVTPQGLMHLAVLAPNLRRLNLNDCKGLRNSDLSFVLEFKELRRLFLDGWKRSDSGLQALVRSNLRGISLDDSKLSDGDLLKLAGLKSLRWLKIKHNPALSAEAKKEFARLRSNVSLDTEKPPKETMLKLMNDDKDSMP